MKNPVNGSATLLIYDRMSYADAWTLQRRLVQDRMDDRCADTLILLEHEPVFTIGRTGQSHHCDEHRLITAGYPVYHVERGGSVTYHGPGQIVGYPILHLGRYCSGPKAYMRLLEEVIIRTLAKWSIIGTRIEHVPGVWIGKEKIAAMGVRIVRGVTMHGFALNVAVDLHPFTEIVPCGISGCRVTSMTQVLGRSVDARTVRARIAQVFADVFELEWRGSPNESSGTIEDREVERLVRADRPEMPF